jgi:hypothetical protein
MQGTGGTLNVVGTDPETGGTLNVVGTDPETGGTLNVVGTEPRDRGAPSMWLEQNPETGGHRKLFRKRFEFYEPQLGWRCGGLQVHPKR